MVWNTGKQGSNKKWKCIVYLEHDKHMPYKSAKYRTIAFSILFRPISLLYCTDYQSKWTYEYTMCKLENTNCVINFNRSKDKIKWLMCSSSLQLLINRIYKLHINQNKRLHLLVNIQNNKSSLRTLIDHSLLMDFDI